MTSDWQVRHCLNAQSDWVKIDGAFNAEKFYWSLVDLLESGDLGRTLLTRINKYVSRCRSCLLTNNALNRAVFGTSPAFNYVDSGDEDEDNTLASRLIRQNQNALDTANNNEEDDE